MKRIFIPSQILNESDGILVRIRGDYFHQLGYTLRCRPGEEFQAVAGDGFLYRLKINKISSSEVESDIIEKSSINIEIKPRISMFVGTLKAGGIEEIIPPLVYMGVDKIYPVICGRSVSKTRGGRKRGDEGENKKKRAEKIVERALALSGRTGMTHIEDPLSFHESLTDKISLENRFNFIFWEEGEGISLKQKLRSIDEEINKIPKQELKIGIWTGPEGGYMQDEISLAMKMKVIPLSLGKRIIDARSAPLVGLSCLLYHLDCI